MDLLKFQKATKPMEILKKSIGFRWLQGRAYNDMYPGTAKTCFRQPAYRGIMVSGIPMILLNLLTNDKNNKDDKINKNNKILFCSFSKYMNNKHLLTKTKPLLTKITKMCNAKQNP